MKLVNSKFKNFITLSVFTLIFSVIGVSAATFTVTNINDNGAGSLRQAILDANAASGADVIAFDAAVFNTPRTITLTSGQLTIQDSDLTINGPGANLLSISGNNQSRSFLIRAITTPVTVTINNMTIKDGNAGGGGGIRANESGSDLRVILNISGVVFRDNTTNSGASGGGIFMAQSTHELNVNNSIFRRNTGNGGGGIACGSGGGACVSVTITNTLFEENQSGSFGGAFNCCGNGTPTAPINLEKVAFIRNSTGGNGSAVRLSADVNTQFNFKNITVARNTAGVGAAMQFQFGKFNFENSTIAYNTNQVNHANGVGIYAVWQEMNYSFRNTIVAKNTNIDGVELDVDIRNRFLISQGYNIFGTLVAGTMVEGNTTGNQIGVNPLLDAVPRENGSFLKTLALRPGSPAIDAGDPNNFLATDQRGIARPVDGNSNGTALPDIGAFEKRPEDIVPSISAFDFDGDKRTDVSIFRPSVGEWWYLRSSDNGNQAVQFGAGSDKLVPADYTGDGKTDIAFWRPSTGQWFILRSEDSSFYAFPFGSSDDIPAPGDYDGDGRADAAVFRPSNAVWYILRSSDGGITITPFGVSEDRPVVGDYDGDGLTDIAVFRPSVAEWWILRSRDGLIAYQFGAAGDKAVPGDYTGDGKTDAAFFRPANGTWYVLRSEDSSFYAFPFGNSSDIPAPGDFDGDGRTDAAVFRPSNSVWYISGTTSGTQFIGFGANGDLPVPNTYIVP